LSNGDKMIKTIPLKDVKIGMCLASSVITSADAEVYPAHFYFTSREQIVRLLDAGIKNVSVDFGLSIVDERDPKEQARVQSLVKKELENPEKRYEKMVESIGETKEIYDRGEKVVEDLMQSARFGNALNRKAIKEETAKLVKNVLKDPLVALTLLDLKNFNEYTYIHSVNVAVLSVAFALNVKFPEERMSYIGQGSILHDIGKARIPTEILNKPDKLSEFEFNIMQKHPILGVQLVEKDNIKNDVINEIILHHHEDYDGSGYPYKIGGPDMKRYASIVAIADFYDALTTERPYKAAMPPPEAIKIIFGLSGTKFDPRVVNHFVKTVGIYPIGSIVELNDGSIASVIAFSKENLLRPIVKILFDNKKQKLTEDSIISLVHSDLYVVGVYADFTTKTLDLFKK